MLYVHLRLHSHLKFVLHLNLDSFYRKRLRDFSNFLQITTKSTLEKKNSKIQKKNHFTSLVYLFWRFH